MSNLNNTNAATTTSVSFDAENASVIMTIAKSLQNGFTDVKLQKEKVQQALENDIETVNAGFISVSNYLKDVLGLTSLAKSVEVIIEKGGETHDLVEMARQIREEAGKQISEWERRGSQSSLMRAAALKEVIGDDGETLKSQSIFGALVSSLKWLSKKITNCLKQWNDGIEIDENHVLKKLMNGLSSIFNLILSGAKIVVTVVGHVLSYMCAAVMKVILFIKESFKRLVEWASNKLFNKLCDDLEEDLDEELEDEFTDENGNTYIA